MREEIDQPVNDFWLQLKKYGELGRDEKYGELGRDEHWGWGVGTKSMESWVGTNNFGSVCSSYN